MIVAVLDTNVLASGVAGIARQESTPGALLRYWHAGTFSLVVSEPILAELMRTLTNPYFASRFPLADTEAALAWLRTGALLQPIMDHVSGVASHTEDDVILVTAVSAQATHLVTGDRKLQAIGAFRDVTILSPRAFLELLAHAGEQKH